MVAVKPSGELSEHKWPETDNGSMIDVYCNEIKGTPIRSFEIPSSGHMSH